MRSFKPMNPLNRTLALILLFLSGISTAQEDRIRVSFELFSDVLPDDATVYVTGSHEQIGNWNPMGLQLDFVGSGIWTRSVYFDKPVNLEYKFTLGTWEGEAANISGLPLPNFNAKVTDSQTLTHVVVRWTDGQKPVLKGQITGTVNYHRGIKGAGLQDRDVIVWLPPDYEENPTVRYPVLYMQDGQNIVDPATSSFGVDWQIDETLDSLITGGKINAMIVVGIYNTSDRTYEYTPGDKGTAYMELVAKTIKPMIDKTYRTLPDRANTYVGGSSAGGIISFMLVWTYPEIFSKALCMSPAFKTPEGFEYQFDFVRVVRESKPRKNVTFYLDNGGVGLEAALQPGIDDMIQALREKEYVFGKHFMMKKDAVASHNEAAWAQRFPAAIQWLMTH